MKTEQILDILLFWNFWEKDLPSGLPRTRYLTELKRTLGMEEIVALTGVRRAGKSTVLMQLLQHLIDGGTPRENTLCVNFEDPKFDDFLSLKLLDEIWEVYREAMKPKGKIYLVLDEVQRIKGWERWVRVRIDRKEPVKIFVTGSNAEFLAGEYSSVITGRHLEFEVCPLSFSEYLKFKGAEIPKNKLDQVKWQGRLRRLAKDYLETGGFPRVVLTGDEISRRELLTQYFQDVLARDIGDRHHVREIGKLRSLALFYASNFTRPLSFNRIGKIAEFSLSVDTIDRFSRYLKNAYVVDFVKRFSYSVTNQMQTPRKVYFVDNGMRQAVAFHFSEDKGKLLENAVYSHLKSMKSEVFYFQEKQEVDFVIKKGLKVDALMNVCYEISSKETRLRETAAMKEAMKYFKLKRSTLIVGEGEGGSIQEEGFTIHIVPFHEWALSDADARR